jgi:hypothetical protein
VPDDGMAGDIEERLQRGELVSERADRGFECRLTYLGDIETQWPETGASRWTANLVPFSRVLLPILIRQAYQNDCLGDRLVAARLARWHFQHLLDRQCRARYLGKAGRARAEVSRRYQSPRTVSLDDNNMRF